MLPALRDRSIHYEEGQWLVGSSRLLNKIFLRMVSIGNDGLIQGLYTNYYKGPFLHPVEYVMLTWGFGAAG